MFVVCVVLLCCSVCRSFVHYMLCAGLFYRCSCFFVSVVVVVVMFFVGVLVCSGCLVCFFGRAVFVVVLFAVCLLM